MSENILSADYEQLEKIALLFQEQALALEKRLNSAYAVVENLQNGAWIGDSAKAFYAEFYDYSVPRSHELLAKLGEGMVLMQEIVRVLRDAGMDSVLIEDADNTIVPVPAESIPPNTGMSESNDYSFTYNHEVGTGKWESKVPHVPRNNSGDDKSGVTIGPGYDMGNRTRAAIKSDLIQAGVDEEVAEMFSTAAGKKGDEARRWVNNHKGLQITNEQQEQLFNSSVPIYERRAQRYVDSEFGEGSWENLSSEQKAMLFDHTYHLGGLSKFPKFTEAVIAEDWNKAAQEYERKGADRRNRDFYSTFLKNK